MHINRELLSKPGAKLDKTADCGVFLVFALSFLCRYVYKQVNALQLKLDFE